jgi:drug/metabolite transporter (DMT)-like permease
VFAVTPYATGCLAIGCYASLPVIAKKLQLDLPPLAFIGVTMMMLSAISVVASLINENNFSILSVGRGAWLGLLLFAIVNFIGFALYLLTIQKMPVSGYQMIGLTTPLIGAGLAFFVLGEQFTMRQLLGFIVVTAGLPIEQGCCTKDRL